MGLKSLDKECVCRTKIKMRKYKIYIHAYYIHNASMLFKGKKNSTKSIIVELNEC